MCASFFFLNLIFFDLCWGLIKVGTMVALFKKKKIDLHITKHRLNLNRSKSLPTFLGWIFIQFIIAWRWRCCSNFLAGTTKMADHQSGRSKFWRFEIDWPVRQAEKQGRPPLFFVLTDLVAATTFECRHFHLSDDSFVVDFRRGQQFHAWTWSDMIVNSWWTDGNSNSRKLLILIFLLSRVQTCKCLWMVPPPRFTQSFGVGTKR